MGAKILAADIVTAAGAAVIITHTKYNRLLDIIERGDAGTIFQPQEELPDKKLWMLYSTIVTGKITVDDGARDAILNGASLLFADITNLTGHLHKNDIIKLVDKSSKRFARSIVNYSADELNRVLKMSPAVRKGYLHIDQFIDIICRYKMAVL